MTNTFFLEQISRTGIFYADLVLRQHRLDSMPRFVKIKSIKPKLKQKEKAKELGYSSCTLQRYGYDIKLQSSYQSNNPKRTRKTSNDLKRPQITSKDTN